MPVSILVIDDESDVTELYRQRFRREVRQGSYAMHFAKSGEEALGKLAGGVEPTLIAILSDINMPGMDGLDRLGEIKRRYPELPVMMGAAEFLTKPVDFDLLKMRLPQLPNAAD